MDKRIVIVGSGAAGVAAATKLLSNGFRNVTVLEAENRIGGRINTVPFGENVIDMGAQWCHGEKNNVVYEMAKDKHLLEPSEKLDSLDNFIRSDGEQIPVEIAKKLWNLAMEIYESEKYEEEKHNSQCSLGNFFANKYKEALKTEEFKDVTPELAHECYDLFHKLINSIDGANSWYETLCHDHEYEECDGDQSLNWKDKGYVTVLDLLQNKIPDENGHSEPIDVTPLVKFNKSVYKITYNQPNELIKVDCDDGSTYTADHLICTVSLGVLKECHMRLFEPLLPQDKFDAIDGMMIGTVDKIFLEFEKPFWDEDWAGFSCLWKLEQIKEVREDAVNGDWLEGLMGFYPFNSHQPNMIIGWIVGESARKMEQKTDDEVKKGAEKLLRIFLKGWDIPDAKAMIRSKWYSNPNSRGSYSNYTIKAEALGVSVNTLARPINDSMGKPVIQFAGEATSPTHFSCVHGAIETGWREAKRIIDLYK